ARLGTTVLVLPHRHPVLAAKMLATLDHLSRGRVILGAGVGWMREEIEILGAPFDERGAWSDEAIRIMRACWREERTSFQGRFFSFEAIGCFPKPTRGDIPIWMGGHAKPALRRIVALADGWHAAFPTAQEMEAGITLLKQECADQGRPFEDLTITLRAGLSIRESRGGPDRRALQGTVGQIGGGLPPSSAFLEPLTALALVAAVTERVRLGTTVLVLPHRHPVVLAKTLATLDHLSGGRVIVGAGVGWLREEVEVFGVPFERRGAWS